MTAGYPAAGRAQWSAAEELDIDRTVAPVRRAIGLQRLVRFTVLGLVAGLLLGSVLLLLAHITQLAFAPAAAVVSCIVGALAGASLGLVRWPDAYGAARTADLHFGLEDRLTTALELRSASAAAAVLQRREAARRIEGLPLTKSRGPWMARREAAAAAVALLVFAGALTLHPAATAHSASAGPSKQAQAAARRAAAARLKQLTAKLEAGMTLQQRHSVPIRRLETALSRLRHQLQTASNPLKALKAISTTQQQLHQIARSLHPINAQAVAQLNSSLSHYLSNSKASNSKGSNAKGSTKSPSPARSASAAAMAQALSRLAQSLNRMTPAQRAALAQALAKAANTTSDTAMRSALRQAASALANSDPRTAQSALQRISRSLAGSSQAQQALSRLAASQSALESLKNSVSGPAGQFPPNPGRGAQSAGTQPGQGKGQTGAQAGRGQGKGRQPGQGQGAGRGQGRQAGFGRGQGRGRGFGQGRGQGQGHGQGQGTGKGQGNGQGTGRGTGQGLVNRGVSGTSGARGQGGQGRSAATRRGHTFSVYVPGKGGNGPEMVRLGPNGAPEPGVVVPYQQVLGQYSRSAHQALDRSALPPALQSDVRRYFSTLSH